MRHPALVRIYADPVRCPDCGAATGPGPRCGSCGLQLHGPAADELWRLLRTSDRLLADMRHERDAALARAPSPSASAPSAPMGPLASKAPMAPALPPPGGSWPPEPPARAPRRLSVAAVLLGLGALLVVVAAFVFLAVTWGRISLETRALILAGLTALAVVVAVFLSRRRLRASAEAAWAVALAMLALDLVAARVTGLLGLDSPSDTAYLVGAGVVLTLAGSGAAASLRSRLGAALVVPQVVSLAGIALAGTAALADWDAAASWRLLAAVGVALLVALGHRVLRLGIVVAVAVATAVLAGLAQVLTAWIDVAIAETFRAAWLEGAAWPSVASVLLLVVLSFAAPRVGSMLGPDTSPKPAQRPAGRPAQGPADPAPQRPEGPAPRAVPVSLVMSSAAFLAAAVALTWVLVPLTSRASPERTAVLVAVAALVLALAVTAATGARGRGVRVLAGLVGALSLLAAGVQVVAGLATLAGAPSQGWQRSISTRLDVVDSPGAAWWTACVQLAVAALSALVVARAWRWAGEQRPRWPGIGQPAAVALGSAAAALPLTRVSTPVVLVCALAVLAGGLLSGLALRRRPRPVLGFAGVALLVLGSYEALASDSLSALVWTVVTVVLAVGTARLHRLRLPQPAVAASAAAAGVLATGALAAGAEALELSLRTTLLLLTAAAAALLAVATALRHRLGGRAAPRWGLEIAALLPALAAVAGGVVVALDDGLGFLALVLTLLGALATVLAVLVPDRRRLAPVAGGLLAVAWWLRLAASEVSTVEAYTLPVATLLLVAGLVAMLRRPRTRTPTALLPGLLLATTPSLPAALDEPTSLRGLLLLLAALALVGVGAKLGWMAPFLVGAAEAVLLALRQLTPYADALPRWVLLAVAGVVLLAVGTTWESRAAQARRGLAAVRGMR